MQIKRFFTLSTVFIFTILMMYAGPSSKHFINGEKWVASDYNPTNTTLLIKNYSYTYTDKKGKKIIVLAKEQAKLEEFMKENYPYSYEFMDDANDAKYDDANKYRYVVYWDSETSTPNPNGSRGGNGYAGSKGMTISSSGVLCDIRDRKIGATWINSGRRTSYASGIFSMTINTMLFIFKERNKK